MNNDKDYLEHFNTFSRDKTFCLSEDLYNSSGMLLLKKGHALQDAAIKKIKEHKLKKPLDESISFDDIITKDKIFISIKEIIKENPVLGRAFLRNEKNTSTLSACLDEYENHIALQQKLTMMKDINPYFYNQTVFSAVMSIVIANNIKPRTLQNIKSIFLAALSCHVGVLHVANGDLQKNKNKIHIISHSIIDFWKNFPKEAVTYVFQSKENCYATGVYNLTPQKLTQGSQIIKLSNDYYEALSHSSHEDFYQFAIVAYKHYFETVSNSFIHSFKGFNKFKEEDFKNKTSELIVLIADTKETFSQLKENYSSMIKELDNKKRKQFLYIFENLYLFERSSGIIHESFQRWVQYVFENELFSANEEIQASSIMLKHFKEQINNLFDIIKENIDITDKTFA